MCGIAGIIGEGNQDTAVIKRMLGALVHRGPDDEGIYSGRGAVLGHRRLSIIDLAGGHQPIANEDGSIWIVFNGEIYNYKQLRQGLLEKGHLFSTHSDTETIVHLYEEYGDRCVEYLRGMFAFAIWDEKRKRLFAARDRLGQKPFFYVQRGNGLYFASEIKALLAADPQLGVMDTEALAQYLALRIVAPPKTMFRSIRKLPPAHTLVFEPGKGVTVSRYWTLRYEPKVSGKEDDLMDELEERMIEAIRLHTISDVPIGAFMSGGLDSTLVVAMLMKHAVSQPVRTFTIGLPYLEFDESPYARRVAEMYGTRHHEEVVMPSLTEHLPRLVFQLDEPSDPLALCSFLIAEMASKHVKVVLGGDGGDELFGGYDRYYGNRYANYYAYVPRAARKWIVGPLLDLLSDGKWYKSKAHQAKWLHMIAFAEGGERYAKSLSYFYFGSEWAETLYGPLLQEAIGDFDSHEAIRTAYERAEASDMLDRMLHADSSIRLPDHPVMILDRMTMAHSLEARSPLMDHELAEFAARLPVRYKIRGRSLRYIQYKLAQRYLPKVVLDRPKQGFSSALPYLLRDQYRLLYGTFLKDSHLARDGILRQSAINVLLTEHELEKVDHGNRLWLLLNAEVWYRSFVEKREVGELDDLIEQSEMGGDHKRIRSGSDSVPALGRC